MLPSEIRERILQDHAVIRTRLGELVALIRRVHHADPKAARLLTQRGRSFLEFFLSHLELENRLLVPTLRDTDAWGAARAERVLREHGEQSAEARTLIEALADPFESALELAEQLENFVAALEVDMAAEERGSLSRDLLRDDVVGIDVEAG